MEEACKDEVIKELPAVLYGDRGFWRIWYLQNGAYWYHTRYAYARMDHFVFTVMISYWLKYFIGFFYGYEEWVMFEGNDRNVGMPGLDTLFMLVLLAHRNNFNVPEFGDMNIFN